MRFVDRQALTTKMPAWAIQFMTWTRWLRFDSTVRSGCQRKWETKFGINEDYYEREYRARRAVTTHILHSQQWCIDTNKVCTQEGLSYVKTAWTWKHRGSRETYSARREIGSTSTKKEGNSGLGVGWLETEFFVMLSMPLYQINCKELHTIRCW